MKNKALKEIILSVSTMVAGFSAVEASGIDCQEKKSLVQTCGRNDSGNRKLEKSRQSTSRRGGRSSKRVLDIQWCIQQLQEPRRKTMQETLEKIYFVLLLAPEIESESAMEIFDALPQAYKCIPYDERWKASTVVLKIGRIVAAKVKNPEDKQIAKEKSDALLWTVLSSRMYGAGKIHGKTRQTHATRKK